MPEGNSSKAVRILSVLTGTEIHRFRTKYPPIEAILSQAGVKRWSAAPIASIYNTYSLSRGGAFLKPMEWNRESRDLLVDILLSLSAGRGI